jgi:hypothetical protein
VSVKIKSLIAVIVAQVLLAGVLSAPAQATGTNVNLVVSNDTLSGTTITGFDAGVTLRLALITEAGSLTWPNNLGSGATLVSDSASNAQAFWLEGTQSQLNAALPEVTISKACAGTYKIYAQVSASGFVKHPVTGHLYKYNQNAKELDLAIADAAATPLVQGGTNTFGYVPTVTDKIENQIVNMFGSGWIGASDRVTEGDWKWLTGPEAGTSFYQGRGDQDGAALPGKFAGWGSGEPNDSNNEDYAEIYGDGRWNDNHNGDRNYAIEWGGMPGDDLSSVSVTSDSIDISVAGALAGNGTVLEPFLVNNATALHEVAACNSDSAYFKQTANFTLPSDWAGDQEFRGHYDGNGKTISYPAGFLVQRNTFGIWRESNYSNSTVSNLTVSGDIVSTSYENVGLLFGSGAAKLTDITVTGSISTSQGRYSIGGVAGEYWGELKRVHSSVNLYSTSDGNSFGGLVGYYWGSMSDSTWDGIMNIGGTGNSYGIGGLVGESDCVSIVNSRATGTITVSNGGDAIGGLVGSYCGDMSDSLAYVDIVANSSTNVGGAAGRANGNTNGVAAYGDVSGQDRVGGLIGESNWEGIYDVYARGNVTSAGSGGSLIGAIYGSYVNRAYATGEVTAVTSRGLYGTFDIANTNRVHWIPSQSTVTEPSPLQNGEVPYTALESKDVNYYLYEGWDISTDWTSNAYWTICAAAEDGYPFMSSFFTEDPCRAPQTLTPTPTISGSGVEGSQLAGEPGTWDSGTTLAFAWLADGAVIVNETNASYTPVTGDVGKVITFRVTSTREGFRTVVRTSLGITITAMPATPVVNNLEITFGGFASNSWWVPTGFWKRIKAGVKAHKNATAITCVGIVGPSGSKAWQKTLGLNRAALTCATAKFLNPKLKTKLTWKVAKSTDTIQRGATIRFNR